MLRETMRNIAVRWIEKGKDVAKSWYFPFICYGILMLVIHMGIEANFGDDTGVFKPVLENSTAPLRAWIDFLEERYQTWSSRLVIESVLILVVHSVMLWRILDTLVLVWIAVALSLMFNRERKRALSWFIVGMVFAFPFEMMVPAGWIATTTNYSWVLAFGLLAMLPVSHLVHRENIRRFEYPLAIAGLIYAVNQEQMCALIFAVGVFFLIFLKLRDGKIPAYVLAMVLISAVSLLFILTCPGNAVRSEEEVLNWFPEYESIPLFRKLEMGYSSTLFEFIMEPNLVFSGFCAVLFVAVCSVTKKFWHRLVAAIPFAASLVMGLFAEVFSPVFPYLLSIRESMTQYGTGILLNKVLTWIPDLLITGVAGAVLVGVWMAYENKKQAIFPIFLLLVGLATRWVMCFSPTIWASGERTFIFLYFCIIAVAVMLCNKVLTVGVKGTQMSLLVKGYAVIHLLFSVERCLMYLRAL